ncbi:MAG: hypothetical protein JW806_08710 [Sedimentisphaerales bacterium]|nr:hypothetical protein [Sedimentisphaerales bacterium]
MKQDWEKLSDDEILQKRIRDLKLQIAGSRIEPFVNQLYDELDSKGINFHPPCYLTDEWLCPDKVPAIGIPFCLAHSRLQKIEKRIMLEVEGGTENKFMKLLRHECGHAMNYAYQLYKKTRWREHFGRFSERYTDSYCYYPYSRKYVIHLQNNYAQSHPDEDFAETFAVWLAPQNKWSQKYKNWPVINKLNYIDKLMKKIGDTPPPVTAGGRLPWSAVKMTSTLAAYYERKKKTLGSEFQGFYDDSLKELFIVHPEQSEIKASSAIREYRRQIVDSVTRWTGHRKYDVNQLLNILARRCDALGLYASEDNMRYIIGVTALIAAIATNTAKNIGAR